MPDSSFLFTSECKPTRACPEGCNPALQMEQIGYSLMCDLRDGKVETSTPLPFGDICEVELKGVCHGPVSDGETGEPRCDPEAIAFVSTDVGRAVFQVGFSDD